LEVKRGDAPDESRPFAGHGHAEMHKMGNGSVMRAVFEPGWKWSEDVAPIAGTKSCQASHLCYVVSGRMRIRMDDGAEDEVAPGDFFKVSPGHDAWVIGSEKCVLVDFGGVEHYALPATAKAPAAGAESARKGATASKSSQK
jgi:hypothetical protein